MANRWLMVCLSLALCGSALMLGPAEARIMDNETTAPEAAQQQRPEVKWNNPDGPSVPGLTHGVFHSPSMEREIGYNVWLPPQYSENQKRYPVVYFLHGSGGNENSDAGGFAGMVQKEIAAGKIPPIICVFPNGGLSGYRDNATTKIMGETMIIKELLPLIDKQYRTIAKPEGRTICGFSMGGGGAIRLAVKYPELFSAAAAWAAALGMRGGNTEDSAAALIAKNTDRIKGHVRFLMVVGDEDLTFASHEPVIAAFKAQQLPYTYKVLPKVGHNLGIYHEQTGAELVQFVGSRFSALEKETK